MTSEDPHGKVACGGVAIDQCIIALSAVTTRAQQRLMDKILRDKIGELEAIDAVNEYMDSAEQRHNPDDDGHDDDDDGDEDSDPGSSDDGDYGSGSDSEDDDDIIYIEPFNTSSSRLPAGVSTLGVETTFGKAVMRELGKRKSNNTPMLGEFYGMVHQPCTQASKVEETTKERCRETSTTAVSVAGIAIRSAIRSNSIVVDLTVSQLTVTLLIITF